MLNRLRRITRDGRWIPEIDGLRFAAIASVFLFHLFGELEMRSGRRILVEPRYWALGRVLNNGDHGVKLFFVISGMILAMPFARHYLLGVKPPSLRKYYLRRVTRLEPPYIVSTILVVSLSAVYFRSFALSFVPHILASLFYLHSLIYGSASTVNVVTWSLEVEIQFYVLAPLFMLVFTLPHKHWRRVAMVLAILAIGGAQGPYLAYGRFRLSILAQLQYFLTGLLVADIFVLDLEGMRSSWGWDVAGLLALAAIFWPEHDANGPRIVAPLAMGLLCVAAMRSLALRRFFANPAVAVIGGMCYSIYLLHFAWMAAIFKLTRHLIVPSANFLENYLVQLVVVGVPVLALSVAFFLLVERPCMDPDWPSKLWRRLGGGRGGELAALDSGGISE